MVREFDLSKRCRCRDQGSDRRIPCSRCLPDRDESWAASTGTEGTQNPRRAAPGICIPLDSDGVRGEREAGPDTLANEGVGHGRE